MKQFVIFTFSIHYQLFNKGLDRMKVITSFVSWITGYKGALRRPHHPHAYSRQNDLFPKPSAVDVYALKDSHGRKCHIFE